MGNFNPLGYTGNITGSTTRLGIVQFDPIDFSVNENGVVSLGGTGALQTLSGNSGGNRPPTGGNIAIVGAGALSVAGAGSTLTISLTPGTALVSTVNSLPPTAGNIIIAGTANQISVASAGSTVTLSLPSAITAPGSITATTTVTATTGLLGPYDSNVAAAGVTIVGATIAADGTDADIPISVVPKGIGAFAVTGPITASTTVTGGTGVTATTGNVTATAGNVVLAGAATQVQVEGGAVTDFIGQATLVAGTVTVANTNIASGDRVFVSRSDPSTSTALGVFDVSISAGASFTIDSRNPTDATVQTNDVSVVDYFIVRQL